MLGNSRRDAGSAGENAALQYLQSKGLKLLTRNYRCRGGEIDLVLLDDRTLVLTEVRVRSYARFGGAAASVDKRKQKRLTVAAKHLLLTRPELARYRGRFDVMALTPQHGGTFNIEWIKDAFRV